jgi:hypothetical protein
VIRESQRTVADRNRLVLDRGHDTVAGDRLEIIHRRQ